MFHFIAFAARSDGEHCDGIERRRQNKSKNESLPIDVDRWQKKCVDRSDGKQKSGPRRDA